jgi:flavin reductase (DIM6/NTAB) family NADH-FMN oxidoreductase RutF
MEKYIKESDYVGVYSGRDENKFIATGLTAQKSQYVNAPYIEEFPQVLHCKVLHILEVGLHTIFVGEIIENTAEEIMLNEKRLPEINKIKPFFYNSSDRAYYSTGTKLGKAFVQMKRIKTDISE